MRPVTMMKEQADAARKVEPKGYTTVSGISWVMNSRESGILQVPASSRELLGKHEVNIQCSTANTKPIPSNTQQQQRAARQAFRQPPSLSFSCLKQAEVRDILTLEASYEINKTYTMTV